MFVPVFMFQRKENVEIHSFIKVWAPAKRRKNDKNDKNQDIGWNRLEKSDDIQKKQENHVPFSNPTYFWVKFKKLNVMKNKIS